jgi:hypothetical protein
MPETPHQPKRRLWAGIGRRWWLIALFALVVVGATVLAISTGKPPSSKGSNLTQPGSAVPEPAMSQPVAPSASASASASPSASAPAAAGPRAGGAANLHSPDCAPRPSACGYPDATNTGVPAGTKLTVVNGDMTVTQAGAVIDSKDIRGCVNVKAPNVTIRRSKIFCADFYGVAGFAEWYQGGGLTVEDTEIDCKNTNGNGVGSYGFTARRINVHNCENGFDVDTSVTIVDSYMHDFYEGTAGHADGVQLAVGQHVVVSHNTILNKIGTSAMISNGSNVGDVLVTGNLMAGGAYTLYCATHPSGAYRVTNNRFSTLFYPHGGEYGTSSDCTGTTQFSGNIWDTNLKPLAAEP